MDIQQENSLDTSESFELSEAAGELKRAYLHLGFGEYTEAIAACETAAKLVPDHPLPPTLKASFELAVGRCTQALGELRAITRRHPNYPLGLLYFAEAAFLCGRRQTATRALSAAADLPMGQSVRILFEGLHEFWVDQVWEDVPAPLFARID